MLSDKIKGFFWHLSSEFAISEGWDLEQDLSEFYKDKDIDLTSMVYSTKGFDLSELDVLEASKGNATEGFKSFFKAITLKEGVKDTDVLLQSMHSGSSDYLFVSDVKEIKAL